MLEAALDQPRQRRRSGPARRRIKIGATCRVHPTAGGGSNRMALEASIPLDPAREAARAPARAYVYDPLGIWLITVPAPALACPSRVIEPDAMTR